MQTEWQTICDVSDLTEWGGVTALVNGMQVALFYLPNCRPPLFATSNFDPFSGANVLSRGIVGNVKGEVVVASPVYKQHFSLVTGDCLEGGHAIETYDVRLVGGKVELGLRREVEDAA